MATIQNTLNVFMIICPSFGLCLRHPFCRMAGQRAACRFHASSMQSTIVSILLSIFGMKMSGWPQMAAVSGPIGAMFALSVRKLAVRARHPVLSLSFALWTASHWPFRKARYAEALRPSIWTSITLKLKSSLRSVSRLGILTARA